MATHKDSVLYTLQLHWLARGITGRHSRSDFSSVAVALNVSTVTELESHSDILTNKEGLSFHSPKSHEGKAFHLLHQGSVVLLYRRFSLTLPAPDPQSILWTDFGTQLLLSGQARWA